jgi:hypothetical protein
LAAIGKPIEASELVSHILAGLGPEYDPLVTSVTTRQDFISLNELYGFMLSYETRLEQHKSTIDVSISTANTAQRQGQSYPRFNHGSSTGQSNSFSRGRGRGKGQFSPHQFSGPGASQHTPLVRFAINKVTLPQPTGSVLTKGITLKLLRCMPTLHLPLILPGIRTLAPTSISPMTLQSQLKC